MKMAMFDTETYLFSGFVATVHLKLDGQEQNS